MQLVDVELGRLVVCAVEETDLPERWLQLLLYAANDLHKGWTHLRIVLPTHSHQLESTKKGKVSQFSRSHTHIKPLYTLFELFPPLSNIFSKLTVH